MQAREEARFECAERDTSLAAQDPPQVRRARTGRPSRQHGLDGGRRRAVTNAGFVACTRQVVERQRGCEVHEGARDGGDRDPSPHGRVRSIDAARAADRDARDAPLRGRRDLGVRRGSLDDALEMGGSASAQERPLAAGEYGRQVVGLEAGGPVTHAIDAAMNLEQPSGTKPLPDFSGRDTGAKQLRVRHDSVRRVGDPCELLFHCPALLSHCDSKADSVRIRPLLPLGMRAKRRGWDSNPRERYEPPKPLSRRLPSASRPPLQAATRKPARAAEPSF